MSRCLAIAALAAVLAAQEEPLEKLAARVRAEASAGRPLEAAKILDEIGRRDPQWPARRDLILQTTAYLDRSKPEAVRLGLDLLRGLQRDFPRTALGDSSFREAVFQLLRRSFVSVRTHAMPEAKARMGFTLSVHDDRSPVPHPVSTITHYRLRDDAVAKAVDAILLQKAESFFDVPREAWERIDEHAFVRGAEPEFDLSRPGLHVFEEVFAGLKNASVVCVSRFDLLVKRSGADLLAWAVGLRSGEPVPGVSIRFRSDGKLAELKTGDDGLVRLENRRIEGLVGILGAEVHVHASALDEPEPPEELVYVTTDRPIYRPGQIVRFKALRRDWTGGRFARPAREPVRVEVRDPGGSAVHETASAWNAEGSLSGAFTLGDEPPLGDYSVLVHGSANPATRRFTVAEYRKPEMEVRIELPQGPPALGGTVRARIRAEYYFGGPAAHAEVRWKASRSPLPPQRQPGRDDPRLGFYLEDPDREPSEGFDGFEETASGRGTTGADGALDIEFDAQRPEKHRSGPVTYRIDAEVTDLSRFAAEGTTTFEVESAGLRLRVGASSAYAIVGGRLEAQARITDAQGRPLEGRTVELAAFTASEPADVEFDGFFKGSAPTDAEGRAFFSMTPDEAGVLRLRARALDDQGVLVEDRLDLPVGGGTRERPGNPSLALIPDRAVYEPGETAKFLVRLPWKRLTGLLTVEGAGIHDARLVRFRGLTETLEIPLREVHASNVFVKLVACREGVTVGGGHEIGVLPSASFIDVEVKADRKTWRPRERGTVSLSTRVRGRPVAAEVELGIVDEPVYSLRADRAPDIRRFFHRLRPDDARSFSWRWFPDSCEELFFRGGGVAMGITIAPESAGADAGVRRNFPDTLLWLGHVRTGDDGKAEVEIEMPDSLTTWRFTARAASGDDCFGSAVSSTLCRKDVLVRLAAPRFFTERDRGLVAGIVHNDRKEDLEFRVRMEADGLEVEGGEKRVPVRAGGEARVEWPVRAPNPGPAKLRLFAESTGGSDAMEVRLPVHPHGYERTASRTGVLNGRWATTFEVPADAVPESAVLSVNARPAGMAAVLDALPGLAGYPYGCVEQTMSRFLPSVVAAAALRRLGVPRPALEAELPRMIDAGLRRLYDFQHGDGGWGWWKTDETHPFMTAYVVYGLAAAKAAGVEVRKQALESALDRLAAAPLTPFAAYALRAGGRPVYLEGIEPKDDEDRAWLVLAGLRNMAASLSGDAPQHATGWSVRRTALVLRAIASADRKDPRLGPLMEWLMLQRRGDSWISTLDTAHVVYALSELASTEPPPAVRMRIDGKEAAFEGGRLTRAGLPPGRIALELEGSLSFVSAQLRFRTAGENLRASTGAFVVRRRFERTVRRNGEEDVEILDERSVVRTGEEIVVVVEIDPQGSREYVMLECPLPAGAEPREGSPGEWEAETQDWYHRREVRDDRVCVASRLIDGREEFRFRIRPTMAGEFHVMPARVFAMYDPDREGTSAEFVLRVEGR